MIYQFGMKKELLYLKNILFLFLILAPILDSMTGYRNGVTGEEGILSKVYRIAFIFLLAMIIMLSSKINEIINYFFVLILITMMPVIYMIVNGNKSGIIIDFMYLLKVLYPIMIVIAIRNLSRMGYPIKDNCYSLLKYYMFVYPLVVVIPSIMGIGFKSYGENGIRGFFSSGNEISIVLGIVFILNYTFLKEKRTIPRLLMTGISGIVGLLTATKAVILIYAIFFLYEVFRKQNIKNRTKNLFIITFIFLVVSVVLVTRYSNEIIEFFNRQLFRYEQLGSSIWNVLFSNRNRKIIPNLEAVFSNNLAVIFLLFGRGFFYQSIYLRNISKVASPGLIEMDFFDVFLQNGFIMFLVVSSCYFKIFKNKQRDNQETYLYFAYGVMLLYSFMAGHVLYNPIASTLLGLLGATLCIETKQAKKCNLMEEVNDKNFNDFKYVS